jgi:hypothetical protein
MKKKVTSYNRCGPILIKVVDLVLENVYYF